MRGQLKVKYEIAAHSHLGILPGLKLLKILCNVLIRSSDILITYLCQPFFFFTALVRSIDGIKLSYERLDLLGSSLVVDRGLIQLSQ